MSVQVQAGIIMSVHPRKSNLVIQDQNGRTVLAYFNRGRVPVLNHNRVDFGQEEDPTVWQVGHSVVFVEQERSQEAPRANRFALEAKWNSLVTRQAAQLQFRGQ
jgi:hypothetical protein